MSIRLKKPLMVVALIATMIQASAADANCQSFWERVFGPRKKSAPAAAPKPAITPAIAPAPTPAPIARSGNYSGGSYRANVSMPSQAALGDTFDLVINLTALENLALVDVTDMVPAGTSLVSTDPPAKVEGANLGWHYPQLKSGETRKMTVKLKATKEGSYTSCATIHALPLACVSTKIGKPQLEITKSGPTTAVINQNVNFNITVKNSGSMTAKNVVITDTPPAGLTATGANSWPVGDLAPGQSRSVTWPARAAKAGKHINVASANGSNVDKVQDDAPIVVLQPGIDITKSGPDLRFIGKTAKYDIVAKNTGETTLTGVTVTDTAPAATRILSAPGANIVGNTATWNAGTMAAGASKSYALTLTTMTAGTHANNVGIASAEGLTDRATAATKWIGVSALLITMEDNPDPIEIGGSTTYTIKVRNQGTRPDTQIKLVATFDQEITPTGASNGGTVSGKTVTFPAYPTLQAGASFTYTITAKGVKEGDHRLKVSRTSTDIPKPTTVEESTRVY
jgi:uncharacterized repeat protein (TIGR01451 family)